MISEAFFVISKRSSSYNRITEYNRGKGLATLDYYK